MSWHTRMDSHGVCPYCGRRGEFAATVVDCERGAVRYERRTLLGFIPWGLVNTEERWAK
jgi:hypothetical protein